MPRRVSRLAAPGWEHPVIATALTCLIAVLVLFLLADQVGNGQTSARRGLEDRYEQRTVLARQFVQDYTEDLVQSVRRHGEIGLRTTTAADELADVVRVQRATAGVLLDGDGRVLSRYAADAPSAAAANVDTAVVQRALRSDQADVEAVAAEGDAPGMIVVTAPFGTGAGRRALTVCLPFRSTALPVFFRNVSPIAGQRSFLVDDRGRILLDNRDEHGPDLTTEVPAVSTALARRSHGTADVAGTRVYFTSAALSSAPWRVVSVVPASSLYAPVDRARWSPWLVFWVVAGMTVGGVGLFSRTLRRGSRAARHALVDGLTGVANRRALDQEMSVLRAEAATWGLLMVDVDHFKRVNDEFGHSQGDEVLRRVAAALRAVVRPQDVVGRWGGEEFVVLVKGVGDELCEPLAERIRHAVESIEGLRSGPVTVSVGWSSTDRAGAEGLLDLADAALFEAKRAGRNRVACLGGEVPAGPRSG